MMLAYGNVWFFNLDEVSFLYPTNPLKNMHDAIKLDLTMFLHYETLEEDGKK